MPVRRAFAAAVIVVFLAVCAPAAPLDFVSDVRPILQSHCCSCHGAEQQKGGLRLDIRSEAFKGGDGYGPSVVPGQPQESPLIQFVSQEDADLQMPPENDRLSSAEIATLIQWVREGAIWPDGVDLAELKDKRDHWSFMPVQEYARPKTQDSNWPRNDIDCFILDRLEQEGLQPAPETDRVTWLRRVTLDLIGLPPSPEQVEEFLKDPREDAYARIVDELLGSTRYGERWAQHWLDVVRYADTHGFEVNTERPNAWPYRDYVIQAINGDTPYDRFVREQIAGDALNKDVATGFLVTASVLLPGQIGADEPSKRLARQDSLDEIVVNVAQTFMGISVGCARCHDHKFEPIRARDYYSMQALVAGVEYGDRELQTPEALAQRQEAQVLKARVTRIETLLAKFEPLAHVGADSPTTNTSAVTKRRPRRAAVNAKVNSDRFVPIQARRVRFTVNATNSLEPCIDELEIFDIGENNIALAENGTTVSSSGDNVVAGTHELRFINDGEYGNSRSWMSNEQGKGQVVLEFPSEQSIDRVVWGRDREGNFSDRLATDYCIEVANDSDEWQLVADSTDRRADVLGEIVADGDTLAATGEDAGEAQNLQILRDEKAVLEIRIAAASQSGLAFAGTFRKPDNIFLLNRGDPEQPGDQVEPEVIPFLGRVHLPNDATDQQRRLALANWIADPQNTLTARVMVNRIWQGHFGTGLVETASDFGHTGSKPTHPELLDWLAKEFVRSGWSVKHMHRLIVLSAAYRQSTQSNPVASAADAGARLLWRFSTRRLDAETIRDSIVAVSGQIDFKMGGPGFDLFDKRGGLTGFQPVESFSGNGLRRMIYAHKIRREREAVFGAFDCPDAGQSTARRRESTTPIQALNLFNSRFTLDQAHALAARARADVGKDVHQQIRRVYRLALSRDPTPDEFIDVESVVHEHGLSALSRVLFNSNEFLFLP